MAGSLGMATANKSEAEMSFSATTPEQLRFVLRDARFRPMIGVDGAKAILDLGEDECLALIDSGELEAFNIGIGDRREVRFVVKTVEHYFRTLGSRPLELTFDEITALVLPHAKPILTGKELQRSFNCCSTHIINLVCAKLLRTQPGTDWRQGPNGSPVITRASVVEFLKQRRIS